MRVEDKREKAWEKLSQHESLGVMMSHYESLESQEKGVMKSHKESIRVRRSQNESEV